MRIENLDWNKYQQQPLEVFCEKWCSLKCRKIQTKLLCQRKIPVNFEKSLRTPLLQNKSGRLLLKRGYFDNEARDILYLLQTAGCISLLHWLKSQSTREASHHPIFMGICLAISRRYQSSPADHLIDDFTFSFLVQLNERRRLSEYKFLSFCSWSYLGGMRKGKESPQGFESFQSDLTRVR